MKHAVIIGAGPAGLTAAYELLARGGGFSVTVLEECEHVGGISKTVNAGGSLMDLGIHRFFSKDDNVTQWWLSLLAPQGEPAKDDILLGRDNNLMPGGADPEKEDLVMLTRGRVSRIFYNNSFMDYPLSLNLKTIQAIGVLTAVRAAFSYLAASLRKLPEDNLQNFYINRFGKVLYRMFFEGYTQKLWGRHPSGISALWGAH